MTRALLAVALVALALEARPAAAADQVDPPVPVTCDPVQLPVVVERRADGLVVAHVEFAAPDATPCDNFSMATLSWTIDRCDAAQVCTQFPARHPTFDCSTPRNPRRCFDTGRVVIRPRGPGLYVVGLHALRHDGTPLHGRALVRVGRRPAGAR